jgi:hypothetical protein
MQSVADLSKLTEIFVVNPNIRFIGVVDLNDNVLLSRMRAGTLLVNPGQTDEEMVSVYPPLIIRAIERLEPILEEAHGVVVRYRKAHLAFYRALDLLIVVSFNPVPGSAKKFVKCSIHVIERA